MKSPIALSLMLLTSSAMASDLGTWGDLWPVDEPDMLTVIENRLQALQQSGEMDQKIAEFNERVVRNSQRPTAVEGIKRAIRYERRWFDPSVRVDKDLSDGRGNVFAKAGQVFNPLELISFNQTLFFIDGDDPSQIAWVKRQQPDTLISRIILVRGNIPQTSAKLDSRIYFDQNGVMTTRFAINAVPARITAAPSGLRLQVEIIPPTMDQYDSRGAK
ncbi:type-F conjugative transfer system protein TraW [Ewingella americana]|uniref:type-F conjugative transfer system protein TraW n=1 Tax=Ewingella americana TaxID=41202 RepID=UPI0012ADACD8|nr:type-F conjugative transfer system protein TraW [Ewingella americana]MRT06048.1 type-F conjugative transfer system protein TraW [Ewingella americana]